MMNVFFWILRLVLAGVFIYAGVVKIGDPSSFSEEIEAYRLVPTAIAQATAVYLPWLEVVVGLGVLLPWTVRGAALVQAGLMALFTVALLGAWWRGLDIRCGCFGGSEVVENYGWLLVRDVVLMGGALLIAWKGAWSARRKTGSDTSLDGTSANASESASPDIWRIN